MASVISEREHTDKLISLFKEDILVLESTIKEKDRQIKKYKAFSPA